MTEFNPIIFIGGMARSGTTFARDLLNSHEKITVGDEIPIDGLIEIEKYLKLLDEKIFDQPWRLILDDTKNERKYELLKYFIRSVTSDKRNNKMNKSEFFGVKTPFLERFFDFYAKSFSFCNPKFIVCVRNPVDTWVSNKMKMQGYFNTELKTFKSLYYRALNFTIPEHSSFLENSFRLQVDKVPSDVTSRINYLSNVFEFLGISLDESSKSFIEKFPVVNKGKPLRPEKYAIKFRNEALKDFKNDKKFSVLCYSIGYDLDSMEKW